MRLRQSLLGSADDCLAKVQFQLADTERRSGSVRAVGTGDHAAHEAYYQDRQAGMPAAHGIDRLPFYIKAAEAAFDAEAECEGFTWDDPYVDRDSAVEAMTLMVEAYHKDGRFWPDEYQVLGTEVGFDLEFAMGHRRAGTIDLVLLGPDGFVYGVDHKFAVKGRMWPSGKEHPRKNNQGPWYIPAMRELFPDANGYRFVFDIMTSKGKFERRVADPQPQHVEAVERKALQVAALLEFSERSGVPLPGNPSSNLCSAAYCDFFSICPHGQILA